MMDGGAKKARPCQWIRTARVDARTPGIIERPRRPFYLVATTARHLHSALFGNRNHDSFGDRGTRGPLLWHQLKWTASRDKDQFADAQEPLVSFTMTSR